MPSSCGPGADIDLVDVAKSVPRSAIAAASSAMGTMARSATISCLKPTKAERVASMRESAGGDAKLYQGDEPFGAANRLGGDFTKKYDWRGGPRWRSAQAGARQGTLPAAADSSRPDDPMPKSARCDQADGPQQVNVPCTRRTGRGHHRCRGRGGEIGFATTPPWAEADPGRWAISSAAIKEHFAGLERICKPAPGASDSVHVTIGATQGECRPRQSSCCRH